MIINSIVYHYDPLIVYYINSDPYYQYHYRDISIINYHYNGELYNRYSDHSDIIILILMGKK